MVVGFAGCEVLSVDDFLSKKGTRCGVLRWFDRTEHQVYRTMLFGDDVNIISGLRRGDVVNLLFAVTASRTDDSIRLVLTEAGIEDA